MTSISDVKLVELNHDNCPERLTPKKPDSAIDRANETNTIYDSHYVKRKEYTSQEQKAKYEKLINRVNEILFILLGLHSSHTE